MSKIYLISPPKIDLKNFSPRLEKALKAGLVPVFQLRLKDYEKSEITKIACELKKICEANNCLFLLNDFLEIALDIGASGVHLGAEDGLISEARKKSPKNFVIGASCYDSRHLAMEAGEQGADYISFGAFFQSKTKISRGKPNIEILEWANELLDLPIAAIGGITDQNCSSLVKAGADFLCVISYIWDHELEEDAAIKNLSEAITLNHL
ncbi:MAG: thiamine-phosphate diphosphorylase [Alphaproteobacteria bacterium RIFCSPLOWO2_01_FULL_40_26]|nr:MAG: thiamine-phosphate diphosphorylase [Alphaproteobacteria bacterium RIFCSPHIGHO2_02_FULL_40_34]OFW95502.1 MAG: thiamine-phosphate diphosphorylase [Alphaproteobacteria bacterium RIFCSPLOWO2_01_FULL_40_26]OFX09318.1 MAG: thiamine-phosphate diphosphorylase [Alphaproteobacteria bacterium RIFCSPLOWO2_02_FULL_40_19]OFX10860.1 MAG: thiamine-phosphate diphosphorylase [Alphaproteobacteria bacterium RIFCSPLOWO2_12_FULL_40_11]